jgi:hypothetical protein
MQWGTQQFKTPVKHSSLQGMLKRKREYSDISEPLLSRLTHESIPTLQ